MSVYIHNLRDVNVMRAHARDVTPARARIRTWTDASPTRDVASIAHVSALRYLKYYASRSPGPVFSDSGCAGPPWSQQGRYSL